MSCQSQINNDINLDLKDVGTPDCSHGSRQFREDLLRFFVNPSVSPPPTRAWTAGGDKRPLAEIHVL